MKIDTYVAQVGDNLPHPGFVQLGESPAVLPKEVSEVAKLAQLRLDVQSVILFPAIDVRQYVWVSRAWPICHRIDAGQMMENLDLLTQPKPVRKRVQSLYPLSRVSFHGHMCVTCK